MQYSLEQWNAFSEQEKMEKWGELSKEEKAEILNSNRKESDNQIRPTKSSNHKSKLLAFLSVCLFLIICFNILPQSQKENDTPAPVVKKAPPDGLALFKNHVSNLKPGNEFGIDYIWKDISYDVQKNRFVGKSACRPN